ncbi:MAG: hypothetical protein ACFFCS_13560 [Candidatus Hodarchaeota archaeon]
MKITVDEKFKQFIVDNGKRINKIVNRVFLRVDNVLNKRLKNGFLNCLKPSFLQLSQSSGGVLDEKRESVFFIILQLLITAIKKRYYAFPDRNVISVVQDHFFDTIIPRLIELGLVDKNLELIATLFNAGEYLGKHSEPFYMTFDKFMELMINENIPARDLVQVIAYFVGDVKRREYALDLFEKGKVSPHILLKLLFDEDYQVKQGLVSKVTKEIHDLLLFALKNDIWRTSRDFLDDEDCSILLSSLKENKTIPADFSSKFKVKYGPKSLLNTSTIATIGSFGRYAGFSGKFDTPVTVSGSPKPGTLILYTDNGKIYHVDYGANHTQVRTLSHLDCKSVEYSRDIGLIVEISDKSVYALRRAEKISTLPKGYKPTLSTVGGNSIFTYTKKGDNKYVYRVKVLEDRVTRPKRDTVSFDIKSMLGIDEKTLIILRETRINKKKGYEVAKFEFPGKATPIATFNKRVELASNGEILAMLEQDGKLHVKDLQSDHFNIIETKMKYDGLKSFYVTKREIFITYNYTHKIYILGPPT